MSRGSPIRQIRIDAATWVRVQRAAAIEGARRGKPYSVSEWVRAAVECALSRVKEEP